MVVGLQVVRELIAPVMDTFKKKCTGKGSRCTARSGECSEYGYRAGTDKCGTCEKLPWSCYTVCFCWQQGPGPVIHYGILSLLYRFLAAIAQPVSEKRIVDSLATMGEGCALLLRILFTAEILCILDFCYF